MREIVFSRDYPVWARAVAFISILVDEAMTCAYYVFYDWLDGLLDPKSNDEAPVHLPVKVES